MNPIKTVKAGIEHVPTKKIINEVELATKKLAETAKETATETAKATTKVTPTKANYEAYTYQMERIGYDGANDSSAFDAIRAHMYPQIFENYNVGKGIVKGKENEVFKGLKHLNEQYANTKKELRLAPLPNGSVRGRNIVTMPLEAMEEAKQSGIERIVDLRAEASVSPRRMSIKNGHKYIDDVEYVQVPLNYGDGKEDLETIKHLPEFFDAMNKGNVYIGCALGSHRTDFAVGLNYALNPEATEVAPVLYLPPRKVTEGVRRIYKKMATMPPENRKALGISDDFIASLPDKQTLDRKLINIANATKEAK